jgi:hypothetical protein
MYPNHRSGNYLEDMYDDSLEAQEREEIESRQAVVEIEGEN